MRVHELYCEFAPQLRRVVLLGRRERQTRVVNRLGRAPSEAGGVAFGCAGAFRIGLQSGVHVACIGHLTGYSLWPQNLRPRKTRRGNAPRAALLTGFCAQLQAVPPRLFLSPAFFGRAHAVCANNFDKRGRDLSSDRWSKTM